MVAHIIRHWRYSQFNFAHFSFIICRFVVFACGSKQTGLAFATQRACPIQSDNNRCTLQTIAKCQTFFHLSLLGFETAQPFDQKPKWISLFEPKTFAVNIPISSFPSASLVLRIDHSESSQSLWFIPLWQRMSFDTLNAQIIYHFQVKNSTTTTIRRISQRS